MSKEFTYAEAGVDRELRAKSKESLEKLKQLYRFGKYGEPIELPYGKILPYKDRFIDAIIEGIGTKVLLAQLAGKYDTIGIDGVAMAVNDLVRQGSDTMFILDNIDAEKSDPHLIEGWMKGIMKGAEQAETLVLNGEIADVADLIKGVKKGEGFHMIVAAVGDLYEKEIIWGKGIKPKDVIIGARSSGQHSNGISLTRKVLFKRWGGYYLDPFVKLDELEKELVLEVLEPTQIYVNPVLEANNEYEIKAAVHITGDAHAKFDKLLPYNPGIGFVFNDLRPQPIFKVIQETAKKLGRKITDEEMLKTYNMGDGFDLVVSPSEKDGVISIFEKYGIDAWQVGYVNKSGRIIAHYNGKEMTLN